MQLHTDLHARVVLQTHSMDWAPSAQAGVERRMLERDGEEAGRATSIVRYAPGSRFPSHAHSGGEELLVLDGTLSDEQGDYPEGTYLRNPPGSAHAPFSQTGCTLLVKLCQMPAAESERLVIDTQRAEWSGAAGNVQRQRLYSAQGAGEVRPKELVQLVRFAPGARVDNDLHTGGEEVLVLDGTLIDEHGRYETGTWLRQPHGSRHAPFSETGCTLYVKRGHLPR